MRSRRGFWLLEMTIALALLTIAGTVGARLFYETMQALRMHQLDAMEQDGRESLVAQLRRDVWAATTVTASSHELELWTPAGKMSYRVEEGRVVRTLAEESSADWRLAGGPQFAVQGKLVTVSFRSGREVTLYAPASGREP